MLWICRCRGEPLSILDQEDAWQHGWIDGTVTSPRERLPVQANTAADPSGRPERRGWRWRWFPERSEPATCCCRCSQQLWRHHGKSWMFFYSLLMTQHLTAISAQEVKKEKEKEQLHEFPHLICIWPKDKTSWIHWQSKTAGNPDGRQKDKDYFQKSITRYGKHRNLFSGSMTNNSWWLYLDGNVVL